MLFMMDAAGLTRHHAKAAKRPRAEAKPGDEVAELMSDMRDYEFGDAADGIMDEEDGDASLDLAAELEQIMEEALAPEVEPAGLAEPAAADDADRILAHWMPRFLAAVDALRSFGEAMAKHPEPESTGKLSLVLTSEGTTQFVLGGC